MCVLSHDVIPTYGVKTYPNEVQK